MVSPPRYVGPSGERAVGVLVSVIGSVLSALYKTFFKRQPQSKSFAATMRVLGAIGIWSASPEAISKSPS